MPAFRAPSGHGYSAAYGRGPETGARTWDTSSFAGRPALLGALTVAGVLLVAVAPAASAHATLLFPSPAADSAAAVSPKAITLTVNETVTPAGRR